MDAREAAIALNLVSGIGFAKFTALRNAFGSPEAIPMRTTPDYLAVPGIGETLAGKLAGFDWTGEAEREIDLADRAGVRLVTYFDESYPDALRQLYDPPLVLYVRGTLGEYPDRAVAVVGTRRTTSYGRRMAQNIAGDAVRAGFTVVSGLAYGVDTVAHQAAVDAGGRTVAVLAGGLMHVHPRENLPLANSIIERGGALISEFPMDFPVSRTGFPRRTRIVAGLARATIVVEAGADSGALITARLALEIGREIFAVPGQADNPQACGCHKLIKEGAALIENFDDVLENFGFGFLPGLAPGETDDAAPAYDASGVGDLPESQRRILACLDRGDASLEELQQALDCEVSRLLADLMQLEMKFLVERGPDQDYRAFGRV
ncbi:MAG: DNA-processing protein DprA [Victivallaceae bacterium]|nr:DNA-processing protein DprA [Victivallaceae bacterium]